MEKHEKKRFSLIKLIIIIAIIAAAVFAVVFFFNKFRVYTDSQSLKVYDIQNKIGETKYFTLDDGLIKYSNDGVSFVAEDGIAWSEAFEISNPVYDANSEFFAVGELKSNLIYLYNSSGLVNKLTTTYPIVDVSISGQGVVAALLEDSNISYIELQDKAGNMLAQGRTAFDSSGYPMDIAISQDAQTLVASYLSVSSGYITSRVVFYDYSDAGDTHTDRIKAGFDFDECIIPTVFFVDDDTVCAVGDNMLATFVASGNVSEINKIDIDSKILTVFNGHGYIGIVLENKDNPSEKQVKVYDKNGKLLGGFTTDFAYTQARMVTEGILLYNSGESRIYEFDGSIRYEEAYDSYLVYMLQMGNTNKYLLAVAEETRIVKLK